MNRETLSQLIKNPHLLTAQHEVELKQMLKVYPYFQALFVLYAKTNASSENIEKAAARTLDRNLLRKIITKNFNPNETDTFTALLKNTEQVNAFEKLRAEAKEEKRKAEIQEAKEQDSPAEKIKDNFSNQDVTSVVVSFDDDESAGSIIYNNQNDFSSITQTELPLEEKTEPTYNPFANDIFDKELSTNEIAIDDDIKLQTSLEYNDDLIKPISYGDTTLNAEENTNYQQQKNYITSTDNFFGEAILQEEEPQIEAAQADNEEVKNINNFFEVPDFSVVDEPAFEPEYTENEISKMLLDPYQARKEEEVVIVKDLYPQIDQQKLESSFFEFDEKPRFEFNKTIGENKIDLLDAYFLRKEEEVIAFESTENKRIENKVDTQEIVVSQVENKIDLLDAYFLRKEEEAIAFESVENKRIENKVDTQEIVVSQVEDKIDLLDAYFLRKEEEAIAFESTENKRIENKVDTQEIVVSQVENKIDLLDTYFLRKEEEAIAFESTENKRIENKVDTQEIVVSQVENKIDLLDTYFLRKEEEVIAFESTENKRIENKVDTQEIAVPQVENKIDLLDAYFLRKEEEALEAKKTKNEVITNEVAHNEDMHDNVLIAEQINLLDTYYLRKEEEILDFESLIQIKTAQVITENKQAQEIQFLDSYYVRKEEEGESIAEQIPDNETVVNYSTENNVNFFTDISADDMLNLETGINLSKDDDVQFFDFTENDVLNSFAGETETVDADFDTTNFFDNHHHDQPTLITSKPIYKKVNQEYQRSLIDKFIKESPTIQIDRNKSVDDIVDLAEESTRENLQVISEHLAKIYADQGRNQKAIEIYQRLSEQNPDKSSHYSTQIATLENL